MENHETTLSLVISNASYNLLKEGPYFIVDGSIQNLFDSTAFMTFYIHVLDAALLKLTWQI
jgi:hypothetical protein